MIRCALVAALLFACSSGNAERTSAPPPTTPPPGRANPANQTSSAAPSNSAAPLNPAAQLNSTAAPGAPAASAPAAPAEPLGPKEGGALFATACTSCHTSGFIEGSRIPVKAWTAEVTKMRKWGALVDEEQVAPFAAWLALKFPIAEDAPKAPRMSAKAALATVKRHPAGGPPGDPKHGKEVYAQSCASCHGASALGAGGGPSLVENPALGQEARFALLIQKGKGRMPGYDDLKSNDIASLLAYLQGISGVH